MGPARALGTTIAELFWGGRLCPYSTSRWRLESILAAVVESAPKVVDNEPRKRAPENRQPRLQIEKSKDKAR